MSHQEGTIIYSSALPFTEINPTAPQIDDYGLDTLTRMYVGRNSQLDAFLANYLDGAGEPLLLQDETYSGMYVVGRPSINRERAFTTVTVQFRGKISDAEPLPTIEDYKRENTVRAVGLNESTTPDVYFPVDVDYYAGGTRYKYYTKTRPSSPRYASGATFNAVKIVSVAANTTYGTVTTETPHGLSAGDYIIFSGVSGITPNINDVNIVLAVNSATEFTIESDVTVAGTGGVVVPYSQVITVTRVRGLKFVSGNTPLEWVSAEKWYGSFDQDIKAFERRQIGGWWECSEEWEWKVSSALTINT